MSTARQLVLGSILACMALPAWAQGAPTSTADGFHLSGTSRLRYEAIDGQARIGFNEADDLFNLRSTLMADYRDGPILVVGELWDSRVYGGNDRTPITTGEVNAVELVQAYVELKPKAPFGPGTTASVQLGRFLLNLGSRRLVAADDYRNTTNGYTGTRVDLGLRGGWKATAIYVLPQQRLPDDFDRLSRNVVVGDHEGTDLVLWGIILSKAKAIGKVLLEGSFFHLGEHDVPGRPSRDRSLNTAAIRIMRDPAPGKFDFEIEGIAQSGHVSTGLAANAARQDVGAWFLHADAGYTLVGPWKPRLSIEYDHASGDRPGGRNGRFDTLFGMRRADLGPAGLYNAFGRTNFISPGVRLEAVPDKRTDLMVSLRPLWLASRTDSFSTTGVRDATGRSDRFAGTQFDGRIRHLLSKMLRLEVTGVLLAKGRFLRGAPNAPRGKWTRYLSLNATAAF